MCLAESAVFRENIPPGRSKADGIMQKRLNMELSRKIAAEITKYAVEYQAKKICTGRNPWNRAAVLQSEKHLENLTTLARILPSSLGGEMNCLLGKSCNIWHIKTAHICAHK